jgi:class 3 adenylate cyclase/predicted ATPase
MATIKCPACPFDNPTGFRFCGDCGAAIAHGERPGTEEAFHAKRRGAERRQLTVLFADLVGSTVLSQQLDPEALREVIRAYQDASAPIIRRFGGLISRFLGDGIMAYFGYPRADEDDPERAVLAGLELAAAVAGLNLRPQGGRRIHLSARIGIETGVVVAGDLIGEGLSQEEVVVGETPNLAAKLQALATPSTVLIGPATHRLLGERFAYEPLGRRRVTESSPAIEVWRVIAPVEKATRFDAGRATNVTPMVNREPELGLLLQRWDRAKAGDGQTILISGEPGIGKSRLTQALRHQLSAESYYRLRFQCSPYHVNTALHPVIAQLNRAAGIAPEDTNSDKLDKLEAMLALSSGDLDGAMSLFARLLSVPTGNRYRPLEMSAVRQKLAVFDALLEQIHGLSRRQPLLVLVEDTHWIDPTSLELIELLIAGVPQSRLLLILTHRPEFSAPWRERPNVGLLELDRLSANHSAEMVQQVAGERTLPIDVVQQIVTKTDGIPLFVEELSKVLLEADPGIRGNSVLAGLPQAIPETLQASLMARLDQLGNARAVAQIGAAIGRQFDHELIASVAELEEDELNAGLDELVEVGLAFASGERPVRTYRFKHALIRDTAYDSMLRSTRKELHLKIARTLERHFPSTTLTSPEILAHHFTQSGQDAEAVQYWLLSGKKASERSANVEAVSHFEQALEMARAVPDSEDRSQKELEILIALGPQLITTKGSGSPQVESVYADALALCEKLETSEAHFTAHWGAWRISKNFSEKRARAERLEVLARQLDDDGLRLQAHHCQWATVFHLGRYGECRRHIQAGLELYARGDYHAHAAVYGGHDPRVCALGEAAQALWLLGFPDRAVANMRQARSWAQELRQAGSLVHVMDMTLLLHRYRRDARAVATEAQLFSEYAEEQAFSEHREKARVFRGWALTKRGDAERGITMMREAIHSHEAIGTREDPPVWKEMLGEACLEAGLVDEGLEIVESALNDVEDSGLRFWVAELLRCKGRLLLAASPTKPGEARSCFEEARAIANGQEARSLELRAALCLAKMHVAEGESEVARALVEPLCSWFVEGFETPDLVEAKQLLSTLR